MGFFKRLLGIGVTAGATVAAVKVAEQVKENNPSSPSHCRYWGISSTYQQCDQKRTFDV